MVGRVTDNALRVHGGIGYTQAYKIERHYRDARALWFEEGTREIQQLVIAIGRQSRRRIGTRRARAAGSGAECAADHARQGVWVYVLAAAANVRHPVGNTKKASN